MLKYTIGKQQVIILATLNKKIMNFHNLKLGIIVLLGVMRN